MLSSKVLAVSIGLVVAAVGGVGAALKVGASAPMGMGERLAGAPSPGAGRGAKKLVAGSARPLGTNLAPIEDWTEEIAFVDVFKASRPWLSATPEVWSDERPLSLDRHGWITRLEPGRWARALMLWDGVRAPKGTYTVLYKGDGELELTPRPLSQSPGRAVLTVDPQREGILLTLKKTNPKDPIRDIQVIVPAACEKRPEIVCATSADCSAEPGDRCVDFATMKDRPVFHPLFLQQTRPFGVVRFMDWLKTNGSSVTRWTDRPLPTDARYTERGVPVEVALDASEALDADPWITIPHGADDDYVKNLAKLLKARVRPDRRVYLEYSNEVWNNAFPQSAAVMAWAPLTARLNSAYERSLKGGARRAAQVLSIAEGVFGAESNRLVRVLGSQAGNPWASQIVVTEGDAWKHADALAIAPYFGGDLCSEETAPRTSALSVDAWFDEMGGAGLAQVKKWTEEHGAIARKHGLTLIAYEGGQHLVGLGAKWQEDPGFNAKLDAINRHPRMKDLYLRSLKIWKDAGGELFVHYTDTMEQSKWGRFGAREYLSQPRSEAPKADALLTFLEGTPRWW